MLNNEISHKYDDILSMPHPNSQNHPRMARRDRAAQFSSFEMCIRDRSRILNLTGHLIKQRSFINVWKEVNANESKTIDTSV